MAITGAALLFAGVSASASVAGALAANEAAEKSQAVEAKQIGQKSRAENRELARSLEQYSQTLRVSAATRGVGTGGSTAALAQSAIIQTLDQARIVARNKDNALKASVARANAQMQSPVLQGIIGGLQGLSLGAGLFPGTEALTSSTLSGTSTFSIPGVTLPF